MMSLQLINVCGRDIIVVNLLLLLLYDIYNYKSWVVFY